MSLSAAGKIAPPGSDIHPWISDPWEDPVTERSTGTAFLDGRSMDGHSNTIQYGLVTGTRERPEPSLGLLGRLANSHCVVYYCTIYWAIRASNGIET
jgi:hypothetical protein